MVVSEVSGPSYTIFTLMNPPKWIKYIGDRNIKTPEDAKMYIQKNMIPQLEKCGYSNYTVIRKSDNVKIGSCGLYDRKGLEGIDLGFAFLPDYEKQGYAFEASEAIVNAAKEKFHLNHLNAITVKENSESQKLLKKLGFKYAQIIKLDGSELLLYKIMLDEKS